MPHCENGLCISCKLDENEFRREMYQVRKDQTNKARFKKYADKKKHRLSNLNNKIFNSGTDNCTNIKKQSINLCSDTNVDKLSINVFENFSSIENNNFKQFDVPFHENLKNRSNMKAYPNTMTMKIIQCHLYHEAWPHKMTKRTNFKKSLKL